MSETQTNKRIRRLKGVVVSDKPAKTCVVSVDSWRIHKKYQKQIRKTQKLHAHDENNEYHTGDKVVIEETRPISKNKRWKVISKI